MSEFALVMFKNAASPVMFSVDNGYAERLASMDNVDWVNVVDAYGYGGQRYVGINAGPRVLPDMEMLKNAVELIRNSQKISAVKEIRLGVGTASLKESNDFVEFLCDLIYANPPAPPF